MEAYTPRILRATSAGLFAHAIEDEMLQDREVQLVGPIDSALVNSLILQLRYLRKEDENGEITMFIDSPGGEVTSGLALYDAMRAIGCPIRTVCMGRAASMAALIFMSGSQRDMLEHLRVMIHDPLIAGQGITGSALAVKATSDDLMRIRELTAAVISEHTGKTLDEVFALTATNSYFEASAAIELGIADSIITRL